MSKNATSKPELTQERLREVLHYNPETGVFTWVSCRKTGLIGKPAGSVNSIGYIQIGVDKVDHKAHRLAFLYMMGEFPDGEVDHINRNRIDNRWSNLRVANRNQNSVNTQAHKDSFSGVKGVSWDDKNKKWRAQLRANGRSVNIGRFADLNDAAAAYAEAARKQFGEFASYGKASDRMKE